jgi:hypothetical protein
MLREAVLHALTDANATARSSAAVQVIHLIISCSASISRSILSTVSSCPLAEMRVRTPLTA